MSPMPVEIGVLLDAPAVPDLTTSGRDANLPRGIQLRVEQANAAGGVEGRQIELVWVAANGAHDGLPGNVPPAWRGLAARPGVVGIIGPGIADNSIAVAETVTTEKVPTICWPGTELARNEWLFHFQAGSLSDEGPFLGALIARQGLRRVGVVQQGGPVGEEYFSYFAREARFQGLTVAAHEYVHVHQTDVRAEVARIRENNPDAVLFLGMGEPTMAFGRAFKDLGWQVPRFANIAALGLAYQSEEVRRLNEGLIWTDQYEPANPQRIRAEREYEQRYGEPAPPSFLFGVGYDMGTLIVEGLRRAPNLTRAGLKVGLERVHQVPCVTGGKNPVMGFSPWDRQAIKGPDLLMYRTIRNGECVPYE